MATEVLIKTHLYLWVQSCCLWRWVEPQSSTPNICNFCLLCCLWEVLTLEQTKYRYDYSRLPWLKVLQTQDHTQHLKHIANRRTGKNLFINQRTDICWKDLQPRNKICLQLLDVGRLCKSCLSNNETSNNYFHEHVCGTQCSHCIPCVLLI